MAIVDLKYEKDAVNPALLSEELTAVLGEDLVGVSAGGDLGNVRVHMLASTSVAMREQVGTIVAAHDANQLTADQQTQASQTTQLAALKEKPWAEWTAQDKDILLQLLAERVDIFSQENE